MPGVTPSKMQALLAGREPHRCGGHISTDEVFGSLGETGRFCETTPYDPRSPYSASKAASAHQLQQQLRLLAMPREADSGGDPQGGCGQADTPDQQIPKATPRF